MGRPASRRFAPSSSPEVAATSLGDVHAGTAQRAVWGRRLFIGALLMFVVAGAVGVLGVRVAATTAVEGEYRLSLQHAGLARAGLDVPWQVTVTREGGYGKELVLAVTGDYFDIYETQGFTPEPSAATRDVDTLYLTFDAPSGEVFKLSYDAYIQPSSQRGKGGSVSVLGTAGQPMATVEFETWLWP